MTEYEGRGVQAWIQLANEAMERLSRADARDLVDAVDHEAFASMMDAASSAGVATGTGGNLIYESAAARSNRIGPFRHAVDEGQSFRAFETRLDPDNKHDRKAVRR